MTEENMKKIRNCDYYLTCPFEARGYAIKLYNILKDIYGLNIYLDIGNTNLEDIFCAISNINHVIILKFEEPKENIKDHTLEIKEAYAKFLTNNHKDRFYNTYSLDEFIKILDKIKYEELEICKKINDMIRRR